MAESVIADFVGSFNSEASTRGEPARGRVVLSQRRLVLAAGEEDTLTIPLSSIFDIAVGHVPPDLGDFFNATVTIAFEKGDRRLVAAVESDNETIEKFSTVLFKAVLNGTAITVKERARVGGRVTGDEFSGAELFLSPGTVEFRRDGGAFELDVETVTEFKRDTREVNGRERPVLLVRHMQDGSAVTTLAAMQSARKMSIFSRYLRLEYSDVMADLEDLELSEAEIELLITNYSSGGVTAGKLAGVLDMESQEVTMLIADLREEGLLEDAEGGPTLTPKGEVVASRYLDEVNE
jgi:helix-turn-helix protein